MLEDDLFLTAAVAVTCECDDLVSVWVEPWTGAAAFVTWSAGSDSGTVWSVVLIVADIVMLLVLALTEAVAGTAAILTSVVSARLTRFPFG